MCFFNRYNHNETNIRYVHSENTSIVTFKIKYRTTATDNYDIQHPYFSYRIKNCTFTLKTNIVERKQITLKQIINDNLSSV